MRVLDRYVLPRNSTAFSHLDFSPLILCIQFKWQRQFPKQESMSLFLLKFSAVSEQFVPLLLSHVSLP